MNYCQIQTIITNISSITNSAGEQNTQAAEPEETLILGRVVFLRADRTFRKRRLHIGRRISHLRATLDLLAELPGPVNTAYQLRSFAGS